MNICMPVEKTLCIKWIVILLELDCGKRKMCMCQLLHLARKPWSPIKYSCVEHIRSRIILLYKVYCFGFYCKMSETDTIGLSAFFFLFSFANVFVMCLLLNPVTFENWVDE